MNTISKPSKEMVRKWLMLTIMAHHPPPSPERIRKALGWNPATEEHKRIKTR
jgi:hypothetical protein